MRYEGPDGAGWSKPTGNADDQIAVKMGGQPELSQDRGDASQMVEDDQDWLGSQHDQKKFR